MAATLMDVRSWASSKNMEVGQRGKIGRNVIDAYNRANKSNPYQEEATTKPEPSKSEPDEGHMMNSHVRSSDIPIHISRKRVGNKQIVTLTFEIDAA